MNRFFKNLLLLERLEIQTGLSEEQIHKRIELFFFWRPLGKLKEQIVNLFS